MKKILIPLILIGFILAGCKDVKMNNIIQPMARTYKLVQIPGKAGLSAETAFTTSGIVDGSVGDTLTMNQSYLGDNGKMVTLNLSMIIPAGAFSGVRTITLTADDQFAALQCSPSMVFDKSLILDYSYTGLNLKSLNLPKNSNGFYFIPESGNLENVESYGYLIDKKSGSLMVTGAQINHFSRFGWTTLDGTSD